MRHRGEGSITKRSDGRYQVAVKSAGKRVFAYARTAAEAVAKLRELQLKASSVSSDPEVAVPTSTPRIPESGTQGSLGSFASEKTVKELIEDWLAVGDLKPGTKADYELMVRAYVLPHIGDIPISKLRPLDIQGLYSKLNSPSVIDKVHRMLHRCFSLAVLWDILPGNPCDRVIKPRYQSDRRELWTPEQLRTFLDETRGHWLFPLWLLAITTGCRLGELLALRWGDVDLDAGTITVSRSVSWKTGEPVFDSPKTKAANRTLRLLPEVMQALKSIRGGLDEATGDKLVFPGPKAGRPMYPSVVQHALKRECKRLGLPEMTPHGLRHLHASLLIAQGVPIPLVSRQLGHANPGITMRIYAHAIDVGDQVTGALNGVLNGDRSKGREGGPNVS